MGLNEFVVTTQMRVRRGNERAGKTEDDEKVVKPDIVLFANGLPLVVMEAKSPTLFDVWKTQAVKQLLRYQEAAPEWHGCGAPELFDYNVLCVAHCGASAAYAAVGAHENEYVEWKSVEPYEASDVLDRFGFEPKGQAQLITGLLAPATLLDVLRDFVVFDPERGRLIKKLPRYQQYRTVKKAVDRVLTKKEPEQRGGVVWHTQGSGKSLTMLWLATKLRREPRLENPTMIIVTDRTQLDRQITETFKRCGFPAPEHAERSRPKPEDRAARGEEQKKQPPDLETLLRTGSGRTIMTTIQKFEDALIGDDGQPLELNASDNVFVMVDEAHRTQYGLLAAKMRKALKNAVFIGFTGTPIDKGFKRSTIGRFGPLIDSYRIKESVEDQVTVPIYYEARLPELSIIGPNTLDRLFDTLFADMELEDRERIRRRYANKQTLAEAERRIEMIAEDIEKHYRNHIKPNGFKAQVVAPSRLAAMHYAEKLRDFQVSAYPIITTTNDDGAEFKWAKEINQEQVISAFKDPGGEPEALVVVDMLLTGFDAPVEQVLYLDREMREHSLLQAIARVNRRCSLPRPDGVMTEKEYGLVVDYYGVSRDLATALADFEPQDIEGTLTELEDDPATVIDGAVDRAEHYFAGKDLDDTWACVEVFVDEAAEDGFKADLFERFNADYLDFSKLMDRFLPDARALAYAPRLTRLTRIRAYVRAHFLRVDGNIDWTDVAAKVKDLIDSRIDAEVRELMKPCPSSIRTSRRRSASCRMMKPAHPSWSTRFEPRSRSAWKITTCCMNGSPSSSSASSTRCARNSSTPQKPCGGCERCGIR
jgi:type I restriction enzyme R subunit